MAYKTREWRNSMRVTLDYNNMTEKFLGDKGFTDRQLSSYASRANAAFKYVKENLPRPLSHTTELVSRGSCQFCLLTCGTFHVCS